MCHKHRYEQHNEYAEKFFDKKMHPGMLGNGFIGEVEKGRKEKTIKSVPRMNDFY